VNKDLPGERICDRFRFKDGEELKIDSEKFFVEYKDNGMIRFEVRNVTNADLGKYRCHATNIYGYDNSIAQLNLESKSLLNTAVCTLLNTLCFATTKSIYMTLSSGRTLVELMRSSVDSSLENCVIIVVLFFGALLALRSLLSDSEPFPCDDSRLRHITEYVFKCSPN